MAGKVVILFGAGASYLDGGTDRPPLGASLYNQLCSQYRSSWGAIPSKYSGVFKQNFEDGMSLFIQNENPDNLVELLRDMAIFFSRFLSIRSNEPYGILIHKYHDEILSDRLIVSSLNYDCLTELAAGQYGINTTYIRNPNGMRFLKLHGSCNFIMDDSKIRIGGKLTIGIQGRFESGLITVHPKDVPTTVMKNKFPPAIALYSKGKEVLVGSRQIKDMQEEFEAEVMKADMVLVIGANPNPYDSHVWSPIAQTSGIFALVGNKNAYEKWTSANRKGKDNRYIQGRFQDAECIESLIRLLDKILSQ